MDFLSNVNCPYHVAFQHTIYTKIIKQDGTSGDLEDLRGVLKISQHYPKLLVVDSEFSENYY